MTKLETHQGGCHCRAIRFEVDIAEDDEVIECNCSICSKKGYLHLIVKPERFRLLTPDQPLVEYRFNTGEAVHRFCQRCGIHPFYTPRSHPDDVDVNARCIEGLDIDEMPRVFFDGQNWEDNVQSIRE